MCTCASDVAENGSSIVAHGGEVYNWHHHNCAFYISIAFEHHHGLLFSLLWLASKRCTHLTFAQKRSALGVHIDGHCLVLQQQAGCNLFARYPLQRLAIPYAISIGSMQPGAWGMRQ